MTTIEEIIEECLKLKRGNQELMIYRHQYADWTAEIGNPVNCVLLGESTGEIRVRGSNLRDAVLNLYEALANDKNRR